MRILVTTCPAVGHLLPLLPLVRTARDRGHDVRIASGSTMREIVARAGFEFLPVGPESLRSVARGIPGIADVTGRRRAVLMVRHGFADAVADGIARDLLDAFDRGGGGPAWRPDLIVHEDMELGAWIVAERLGIPHATVQVTAWRPRVRDLLATSIEPHRVAHGLADDATDRILGSLFFITRPPSMRDPADPFPDGAAELRPIADDHDAAPFDGSEPPESAAFGPDDDGAPRILVTLGTVNAGEHGVLHALVDGAAATGGRVVVALGGDPEAFGPVPANVTVRRYVPMSSILPAADVIAFHGGSGTLTAALATARPMVIVPLAADQLDNADRVEAAGVGRSIALDDLTAEAAQATIVAVLGDPSYGRRATEIAAEVAAMPGPEAAVDRLERLVAGR